MRAIDVATHCKYSMIIVTSYTTVMHYDRNDISYRKFLKFCMYVCMQAYVYKFRVIGKNERILILPIYFVRIRLYWSLPSVK